MNALSDLRVASRWTAPGDSVFAGAAGNPIWADNLAARVLKPTAMELGAPWLSWHGLRHTFATLTKDLGMSYMDRQYLMGHASTSSRPGELGGDIATGWRQF